MNINFQFHPWRFIIHPPKTEVKTPGIIRSIKFLFKNVLQMLDGGSGTGAVDLVVSLGKTKQVNLAIRVSV